MKRRGFIAGLFLAPIALRFAGALSPKAIAPAVEPVKTQACDFYKEVAEPYLSEAPPMFILRNGEYVLNSRWNYPGKVIHEG